ncbi:hypothetical protein PLESTF_000024300 [Pleodorina starrii]|nr:hypothetical protein PLESTF_000024300 [Pleodorina starrii]
MPSVGGPGYSRQLAAPTATGSAAAATPLHPQPRPLPRRAPGVDPPTRGSRLDSARRIPAGMDRMALLGLVALAFLSMPLGTLGQAVGSDVAVPAPGPAQAMGPAAAAATAAAAAPNSSSLGANSTSTAAAAAAVAQDQGNATDQSGLSGIAELGASYTPLPDDGGRLSSLLLSGAGYNAQGQSGGAAASGGRGGGSGGGSGSGSSACLPYKDSALDAIDRALRSSLLWTVQRGAVDFGFLGDDVPKNCEPNCAFSNPNAPYGLTFLPLAPNEAQTKAFARSTPRGVANELRGSGLVTPSLANSSASAPLPGSAPIYQLMSQEVVLVAGCTPPAAGSVYFSATPYIHTVWSESGMKWVSVFGSMGDSASTHRPELPPLQPPANLSTVAPPPRPQPASRLATFPPQSQQPAMGQLMLQAAAGAAAGRRGRWARGGAVAAAMAQSAAGGASAAAAAAAAPPPPPPEPGFDRFFVTAMTASPAATAALSRVLQPVLDGVAGGLPGRAKINLLPIPGPEFADDIGLDPRSPYYMLMLRSIVPAGGLAAGFRPYAAAQPMRAWRLTPLAEARELPAGPLAAAAAAAAAGGGVAGLIGGGLRRRGEDSAAAAAAAALTGPNPQLTVIANDRFALPSVVPRKTVEPRAASAAGSGRAQQRQRPEDEVLAMTGPDAPPPPPSPPPPPPLAGNLTAAEAFRARRSSSGGLPPTAAEAWLAPAFEYLKARVQEALEAQWAMAWSLTTGSWLGALDPPVDWGLQCLEQMIDYCNGDNRDVTYLSSFPYVTLNRLTAQSLVVGVHHVRTGTATYMSIALSDPTQRLGLQAFDGSQLQGSADRFLKGTPYEQYAPYLFVATFARNCTDLSYCSEIPTEGPRSTPLGRNMVATLRAYINPITGVGPDPDDLLKFTTVNLVRKGEARPADSRPRQTDPAFFGRDGCTSALLGQVLCAQGPDEPCCRQVQKWSDTGCWCLDTGKALINALGPVQGRAMLTATSRLCRATRPAIQIAEC